MAKSKKPRKTYRPGRVDPFAGAARLIQMQREAKMLEDAYPDAPASADKRERLMGTLRSALEGIARGTHPGEEDWRLLSDAVNLVETMEMRGNLDRGDTTVVMTAALKGMVLAAERYRAGKGMRMDGEGMQAMRQVLDIYEQTLEGLPERETVQIMIETQRRVSAVLAGRNVSDRTVIAV